MNDLLSIFHLVKSLLLQTFMYAHDGMENVYARISIYIYIYVYICIDRYILIFIKDEGGNYW